MEVIIKKAVRTLALLMALCATGGAWAAAPTPTAVWETGKFEDAASSHGGYSITLPTGASIVNGNIVLTGSEATGALINVASVDNTKTSVSVLIKYSGVTAPTKACSFVSTYVAHANGSYDMHAISVGASLSLKGQYNNTTHASDYAFSSPAPALTASGYFLFAYNSGGGTSGYAGGTLDDLSGGKNTGLKFGSRTISKIGIGGPTGMAASTYPTWDTGVTIEAVAIFVGQELSASNVKEYYFPSEDPTADFDYATTISENTTLSDITTWTKGTGTPDANSKVYIACENDAVLTISGSLSLERLKVVGGSITLADGASVSVTHLDGPVSCPSGTYSITGATITGAITASASSTINFTDCAINGGILAPQNGNVVVNTYGTVTFGSSADNDFKYSTTLNVESGTTTYNSAGQKLLWCNINVKSGATFVNAKDDGFNWSASASYPIHAYIRGTLTMNAKWTLGEGNYIHLYSGAVVNGSGNLHFNTGTGKVVVEEDGDYTIAAPFNTDNGTAKVEVKGSATLTLSNMPNNLKIEKAGTGTLKWSNKVLKALSGTGGTIEIDASSGNLGHTFTSSTYNGVLKLTGTSQNNLVGSSTTRCFDDSVRPELIADAAATYLSKDAYNGQTLYVRNLSGKSGATLDARMTTGPISYTLDTLQERDTEYLGKFYNNDGDNRVFAVNVTGNNVGGVHTLTLGGDNASTADLTVSGYAKVKFSSSGKWSKGTVIVGNNGVLESENSAAIAATLKVEEGATLKFASGVSLAATAYDWSGVSNAGSVTIDLSAITPSATPVTLIASGVTVTADKFTPTGAQRTATLSVDNGALKATFANYWRDGAWSGSVVADEVATLYISQNSTLTVSEALSLGAVTVVKEGEGNVTLTISGAGALTTGGWTIPEGVTVNTPASMSISGTVSGGGVLNIPANTTLAMDDVTCSTKVTVSGTLETSGATTLSEANTSAAGSLIHVVDGSTTLSTYWQGMSGDINVASGATLTFGASLYNGTDYHYNNINPNGTLAIDVYGTLNVGQNRWELGSGITFNIHENARVTEIVYAASGALDWTGNGMINVDGDAATLAARIKVRDNVVLSLDIAGDASLAITSAFVEAGGGSIIKSGAGTLDLTAITPSKSMTINAGVVSARSASTIAAVVNESGVFELTSTANVNDANYGNGATSADLSGITGTGTLKYSSTAGWRAFPTADDHMPASTLTLQMELEDSLIISKNNGETVVGSLAGSKNIRSDFGNNGGNGRILIVTQSKDTEWEGTFVANRLTQFNVVAPAEGTPGTLTLSGTQSLSSCDVKTIPIQVDGVVNLTGTWVGATTVDGTFGGTGNITGDLTFNAGSTFKVWGTDADGLVATGALTLPVSGKVTVDVSDLTLGANDSYPILTVGSGLSNTSAFADLDSETHMLSVSSGTLYVVPIAAIVTSGSSVTKCSSVDAAIGTMVMGGDKDAYVTVLRGTTTYTEEELAQYNVVYDSSDSTYSLAAAQIDSTKYGTLAKAIAAAESSGDTVNLLRDTSVQNIALGAKSITLAENSNTFSGSFTGSGTLILGAPLAAADPARWAEGWTGTVELKDITTVITDFDFADYGNANSTVRANNVLVRMPETGGEYGNVGKINLVGEGLRFGGDPIAGQDFTFSAAISGTGKIRVGTRCETASPAHTRYIFKGDLSDFAGGVDYNETGWYKATIVFQAGTDEIPAGDNGEWGQIILTENTSISLGGEMYGPAGIVVAGTINVLSGGSVRVDSPSGKQIKGSGKIVYATFPASAPAFNDSWSGEVHLPGSASIEGTNFGNWGKSGSKIVLDGDIAGRIAQNTAVSAEMVLDGHSLTVNDFSPSSYSFSKISGSGNISFNHKENGHQPSSLTIGEIAPTYSGTVNNNTTATLNITTIALTGGSSVAAGTKLLKVGGTGSFSVGSVTVGGVTQSGLQLAYASDGVYVARASYDGNGYTSVAAAIAAALADEGGEANLAYITVIDGTAALPDGYMLVDGHVAKVRAEVIVYGQSSGTKYASIEEAISDSNPLESQYVKVYESATVNTDKSPFLMECAENVEVEVVCTKPAYTYNKSSNPIAGNMYSYSVTEAAATFTWKSNVSEGMWGAKENWLVGGESVDRAPKQSFDTVVINSAATISVGNDISTVNRIEVGAAVTLTAAEESSPSITATSGVVLTDADASITVSGVTLSPPPTTSVAGKMVVDVTNPETSAVTYSVVNIAATIGGTPYATLEDALAVEGETTIMLVQDVTGDVALRLGQILFLNGNTISGAVSGNVSYAVPVYNSIASAWYCVDNRTNSWIGTSGGSWDIVAGWYNGVVPGSDTAVTINSFPTAGDDPTTTGSITLSYNVSVKSITLGSGVALTLNAASETTPTLTVSETIYLTSGQTITLGAGVTLDAILDTNDARSRIVYDSNTKTYSVQVIPGTIFSVY